MKDVKAKLQWYKIVNGETKYPKDGYSTVAWFEKDKDKWPDEAWSLVLNNIKISVKENEIIANVRFLVPEKAPKYLLNVGSVFKLYEGRQCVAEGQIL